MDSHPHKFRPPLRLILGFLLAIALPGLFIATPFLIAGQWLSAILMLLIGLQITVPPVLVVVVPLYLWLKKKKPPEYILGGTRWRCGGCSFRPVWRCSVDLAFWKRQDHP